MQRVPQQARVERPDAAAVRGDLARGLPRCRPDEVAPAAWVHVRSLGGGSSKQLAPTARACGRRSAHRWKSGTVRVLSVNARRLLPTGTKSAPPTSRNSRELSARLGRCHCLRLVLSRLRLPVPPPRRAAPSSLHLRWPCSPEQPPGRSADDTVRDDRWGCASQ